MERLFRTEWPTSAEVCWPTACPPRGRLRNPALAATWRRLLDEAEAASPDRDGRSRPPGRLLRGLRGRGNRRLPGHGRGPGRERPPPQGPARRRRPGRLASQRGAAGVGRAHGWTVCKTGPWGQGPVLLQQLRLLEGFDLTAMGLGSAGLRPHGGRVRQARLRRPGGLVRRPGRLRRAHRRPARPGLRRPPPGPGRGRGVAGAAPGPRTGAPRACRRRDRAGHGRGARRLRGADLRRHLPRGRGRPPRQPGRGHPQRRLAAELADRPRPRLLPRHPGPDALAGGGAGQLPAARTGPGRPSARPWPCATASPAWPSGPRAGTPRTSGPCSSSWPTPVRPRPPAGGRHPKLPERPLPELVWPRRALRASSSVEAGLDPATIGGLRQRGAWSRWPTTGRSAAPAPPAATRPPASWSPPRDPAAAGLRGRPVAPQLYSVATGIARDRRNVRAGQGGRVRPRRGADRLDPRYLYRKLLDDEAAVEEFLATVCTPEWNAEQDRGRPFAEGVAELAERHPAHAAAITAYHERWPEMLGGAVGGTGRGAGRAARRRRAGVRPHQLVGRDLRDRPRALRVPGVVRRRARLRRGADDQARTRPSSGSSSTGSASTPRRPSTSTTARPTWPPRVSSASTPSGSPTAARLRRDLAGRGLLSAG